MSVPELDGVDMTTVLTRVLVSGVLMSIEKADRELPALERVLTQRTSRAAVVLLNSRTAAIHAALTGHGIGHGNCTALPALDGPCRAFVSWLGVTDNSRAQQLFDYLTITPDNVDQLDVLARAIDTPSIVVDLTDLGFGPVAALLTDDLVSAARAERLKIFGSHDLRTMWTQQESAPDLALGVQFNYRLSPLIAACVRMAINRAAQSPTTNGAHP